MYDQLRSTQATHQRSFNAKAAMMMSTVLFGTGTVYAMESAETWRHFLQQRVPFIVSVGAVEKSVAEAERPDIRTPTQHIENIRKILNPAMSELGSFFDLSRQAIYKWLSGSSAPEETNLIRLQALSKIADTFSASGIQRADILLKMKTFGGRSLFDLIKAGENRNEHIDRLIAEARAMEASYLKSGLAQSKATATNDWQSSISIPGTLDQG